MGLDIGLEQTGRFEVRACVEKEPAFCETIHRNRSAGRLAPDLRVYETDITDLDPERVLEKIEEATALVGLGREEKARRRRASVWREIDKSVVIDRRRYLVTIKSGPNIINDTQVQAMTDAITEHRGKWLEMTRSDRPEVEGLDVVVGLTYGTDRTTNNKENQILVKLLESGFEIDPTAEHPDVLRGIEVPGVRVYRVIGQEFWAFIGNPKDRSLASAAFLEVLLGLAKALAVQMELNMEARYRRWGAGSGRRNSEAGLLGSPGMRSEAR